MKLSRRSPVTNEHYEVVGLLTRERFQIKSPKQLRLRGQAESVRCFCGKQKVGVQVVITPSIISAGAHMHAQTRPRLEYKQVPRMPVYVSKVVLQRALSNQDFYRHAAGGLTSSRLLGKC